MIFSALYSDLQWWMSKTFLQPAFEPHLPSLYSQLAAPSLLFSFSISIFPSSLLCSLWKFGQHFDAEGTFEGGWNGVQGSPETQTQHGRRSLQPVSYNTSVWTHNLNKFAIKLNSPFFIPGVYCTRGRIGCQSPFSATGMLFITGRNSSVSLNFVWGILECFTQSRLAFNNWFSFQWRISIWAWSFRV